MVLKASWLDCCMPNTDLWPAVARTLKRLCSAQEPCKACSRERPAAQAWGGVEVLHDKMLEGKMLWESKKGLSGNGRQDKGKEALIQRATKIQATPRTSLILMCLLSTLSQSAHARPKHNPSHGKWQRQLLRSLTGV